MSMILRRTEETGKPNNRNLDWKKKNPGPFQKSTKAIKLHLAVSWQGFKDSLSSRSKKYFFTSNSRHFYEFRFYTEIFIPARRDGPD
jgi:hypothetical protein